jgi:hypothetical protein
MTVTLLRAYQGYSAGQVVDLPAELEAALIAQGLATTGGTPTSGAIGTVATPVPNQLLLRGSAYVAAGASSVVVTIPGLTAQSVAHAEVNQAAADTTFTSVLRSVCGTNTLTITGPANATAATKVGYIVAI